MWGIDDLGDTWALPRISPFWPLSSPWRPGWRGGDQVDAVPDRRDRRPRDGERRIAEARGLPGPGAAGEHTTKRRSKERAPPTSLWPIKDERSSRKLRRWRVPEHSDLWVVTKLPDREDVSTS